MQMPNVRWVVVLGAMLLITFLLVAGNFLPWLATVIGVFVGLVVYHYFFVWQVKQETDRQRERAEARARNQATG
jgi:hypothetical protein